MNGFACTERLHRKMVAALRKHGNLTINQLRTLTGHTYDEINYILYRGRSVDGVKFVRVGETKVRSHTAYVYGIVECQRTQLELLNDMAKLAKECGRLYRIGRRTEVMETFEAWQRLSNEFRQNAQNGQI